MLRIHGFPICALFSLLITSVCLADGRSEETRELRERVRRIESSEGQFSNALYEPLRKLGRTLLERGRLQQAIVVFQRMQNLVHRNRGVYSPAQRESVELMIDARLQLGEIDVADTQHRFLYRVAERNYERDATVMREARWRLANWYRNTGRHDRAMSLYEESREQLTSEPEAISELAMLLRAEALTMYMAGRCCASDKLEEALALSEQSSDFDMQDKQRIALEYADMLMMERKTGRAKQVYAEPGSRLREIAIPRFLGLDSPRRVLAMIDSFYARGDSMAEVHYVEQDAGAGDRELPAMIGFPVTVCSAPFPQLSRDMVEAAYIDVELEVDDSGRARRVELEGNAPFMLVRYFRKVLLESRYRPRIGQQGDLTHATLTFRERFSMNGPRRGFDDVGGWNAMMVSQACLAHAAREGG